MGKRIRGAALRAKKRVEAHQEKLADDYARQVTTKGVVQKSNEELFVLDTAGTADSKRQLRKKEAAAVAKTKRSKGLSEKDLKQVQSLLDKHENDKDKLSALAKGNKERIKAAIRKKQVLAKPKFDLWGGTGEDDDGVVVSSKKKKQKMSNTVTSTGIGMSLAGTAPAFTVTKSALKTTKKRNAVSVDVAHGGQSYQPDPQQHQDIIGEALSLELRRKEALDYIKAPISQGLSEETKALMVNDSDESDSSDDDDDDKEEEEVLAPVRRKKEKLTRAQRNRQKRVRAEQAAAEERKRTKKLLNSVQELKKYSKEISRIQNENKERKEWIKSQKEEEKKKPMGVNILEKNSEKDPIRVSALPVALTEELGGSLRTLKPKGSLITDRIDSMIDRKMANRKYAGDRKKIVQGKKRKVRNKDMPYLLE